jgi:hypothetical protein
VGKSIYINSVTPHLFTLHPNLSDEVNHNIVQSEIEGGVYLEDLAPGSRLEVQTQHVGTRSSTAVAAGRSFQVIRPIVLSRCV